MLIDDFLPRYSFRERHSVVLPVPPPLAYRAVLQVRSKDIAFMDPFFFVRRLPAKLRARVTAVDSSGAAESSGRPLTGPPAPAQPEFPRHWPEPSLLSDAVKGGFVFLGEEPGSEVVLGMVGRLWAFFGSPPVAVGSPRGYLAFDEPGYARTAWNFAVQAIDSGAASRVSTETRVWVADPGSAVRFGAYWLMIYPGSALIRRMMLRAVRLAAVREARRAEAATGSSRG